MKDCDTQASGMTGDARKSFMSTCLSGASAETKKPHCTKGKPCGNSCIPKDLPPAQKNWRRIDGINQLPKLIQGVRFTDGIEVIGNFAAPHAKAAA